MQYPRGQLYSTAKVSRAETKKGEGVEILVNEPTVHEKYGPGQYTKKIYHLGRYARTLPAGLWIPSFPFRELIECPVTV